MHRYQTYHFHFQLLRQKIVWAYNIAAVCYNSYGRKTCLSQILLLQYKANPYFGFQDLGCHCKILGCHFDTQKRLEKKDCPRPKCLVTETAQTETAQTETARPNRPDRKVLFRRI